MTDSTYIIEGEIVSIRPSKVEVFAIQLESVALRSNESLSERSGSGASGKEGRNTQVATHLETQMEFGLAASMLLKCILATSHMYFVSM